MLFVRKLGCFDLLANYLIRFQTATKLKVVLLLLTRQTLQPKVIIILLSKQAFQPKVVILHSQAMWIHAYGENLFNQTSYIFSH